MKTIKMQSKSNDIKQAWQDIQQMQQQKKEHKQFRQNRQSRKGCWQTAE